MVRKCPYRLSKNLSSRFPDPNMKPYFFLASHENISSSSLGWGKSAANSPWQHRTPDTPYHQIPAPGGGVRCGHTVLGVFQTIIASIARLLNFLSIAEVNASQKNSDGSWVFPFHRQLGTDNEDVEVTGFCMTELVTPTFRMPPFHLSFLYFQGSLNKVNLYEKSKRSV